MDGFLAANPFRISPMVTAPEPAARSADVVVTGSLATAVLRGTLPRAGAWLEDKGKLRLVLVGTSFDVYTLKWVTYREAVFVKGEERVVKQLLYGEPGLPSASAAHASDAAPVNVPVGSVVAAKRWFPKAPPPRSGCKPATASCASSCCWCWRPLP